MSRLQRRSATSSVALNFPSRPFSGLANLIRLSNGPHARHLMLILQLRRRDFFSVDHIVTKVAQSPICALIMKHDFAATAQQYKRQLGKWGLRKNVLAELDVIDDESIARGGKVSQRQIRRFERRKQLKTQKPAKPKSATPRTTRSRSAQKRRGM
ncbi:Clr5 domain-containing protein isoform 1 [Cladophialophora immunda]|nr:Clr5 domain-containing protein isoform 1 [Cladophialophora immunda]